MYDGDEGVLKLKLGFFVQTSQSTPVFFSINNKFNFNIRLFLNYNFKLYCLINNNGIVTWKMIFFKCHINTLYVTSSFLESQNEDEGKIAIKVKSRGQKCSI